MNFDLTDEHTLLEQSTREWAAREVAPTIRQLDREHRFDRALFPKMAELGLLGVCVPASTAAPAWTTSASAWRAKSWSTSTRRCASSCRCTWR